MKRKTNLFYKTGDDSKFITFSNYTECLTGNFLSTDTKLYPSKFLCLYLPYLDPDNVETSEVTYSTLESTIEDEDLLSKIKAISDNNQTVMEKYKQIKLKNDNISNSIETLNVSKEETSNSSTIDPYTTSVTITNKADLYDERKKAFLEYLAGYYENKLALLRDKCKDNDENCENYINPLVYLLEALMKVENITTYIATDENNYDYYASKVNVSEVPDFSKYCDMIKYVGDLTEQDFNGTFTDSICIVDMSKYFDATIQYDSSKDSYANPTKYAYVEEYEKYLYGWVVKNDGDTYNCTPREYQDTTPIYDAYTNDDIQNCYVYDTELTNLLLNNIHSISDDGLQHLKFNVVIPLFDVTNINYNINTNDVKEYANGDIIELTKTSDNISYNTNVPLGMWFSGYKCVDLYKNPNTKYSPTWSLMIGSQFKPFPYSYKMPEEVSLNSMSNAFPTFAMILSRQNGLLDTLNKTSYNYVNASSRIKLLESRLNNLSTSYTIDGIHKELINYESSQNSKFDDFKEEIMTYISNLRWKYI